MAVEKSCANCGKNFTGKILNCSPRCAAQYRISEKVRINLLKPLPDHIKNEFFPINDRYYINNVGDIYSVVKGGLLTERLDRKGYKTAVIYTDSGNKTKKVHRLMAEAFLPNPENLIDVNHKNGIPGDNSIENLEWVSRRENLSHRYFGKKTTSKYVGVSFDKSKNKWVCQFGLSGDKIKVGAFNTEIEAHQAYVKCLNDNGIKNRYLTNQSL